MASLSSLAVDASSEDIQDYTHDLQSLAQLVSGQADLTRPQGLREVLERALESLAAVIPYDLATIFRLTGDELKVLASAGPLSSSRIRQHALQLTRFPTMKRALEMRRPVPLSEHHHTSDEGDPYQGVLDLPHGHSCMVVPMFAGQRNLGIITFDRSVCQTYPSPQVELAGVYGQLIAMAILFAEQASLLDRYRHQLKEQNRILVQETLSDGWATHMLESSTSPLMIQLVRLARQVASVDLPVHISGETGTGKEVLARAIHGWSPRVDSPFVTLNCSALPEHLVESELFGHVKGAFSGADRDRRGRFLTANGGTLLLDEIGDMPLNAQAKLLRVLQEGTFEPVGSDKTVKVDVRVLSASHVDLKEAIRRGRFREDLYYRLSVFPLHLPALRDRRSDIVPIAEAFLARAQSRHGRGPWRLGRDAAAALEAAPWPGNIRELLNVLERATILQPSGRIGAESLGLSAAGAPVQTAALIPALPPAQIPTLPSPVEPPLSPAPAPARGTGPEALLSFEDNERRYFESVLRHTGGKIYGKGGAAEIARLKPTTLRSRLQKLGLRPKG